MTQEPDKPTINEIEAVNALALLRVLQEVTGIKEASQIVQLAASALWFYKTRHHHYLLSFILGGSFGMMLAQAVHLLIG